MAKEDNDLSNVILIVDTVKKLIDVLDKRLAKEFFALMRKLTAKGMTIILLAHTNKHKDENGLPIYEGTADMRSDVDELIYLLPYKHDDGSLTVTTKPDKVRGSFKPITFTIDKNRQVNQEKAAIDVATMEAQQIQQSADQSVMNGIIGSLTHQSLNQKEIITYCTNIGLPERAVKKHCGVAFQILQGNVKSSDVAKQIAKALDVHPDDMGKIIGRSGNTAKAIRTLLRVVGLKNNARVNLKISEPEKGERSDAAKSVDEAMEDLKV